MKIHTRYLVPGCCLLISGTLFAYVAGGYHGGGYHGGYHGGNYYHDGYYNHYHNNWDGGSTVIYGDGIFYDDNLNDDTGVVVGVPAGGYYDPSCQTIDDCSTGTCVLVNTCGQE
jgi:hypothetical protein